MRAGGDHPAEVEDDELVAHRHHQVHVVLHEHHRHPVGQPAQELSELGHLLLRQPAGRLVAPGVLVRNAPRGGNGKLSEAEVARGMLADVPAGRFGEAREVAAVAAFLCTPAAAYVNGVSIAVDGGRTRALA